MLQRITNNRILYHSIFWAVFILAFTVLFGWKNGYLESLKDVSLVALTYGIIVYVNLLWLIPKLLLKKKYVQYFLWLVVAIVLITPLRGVVEYYSFYYDDEKLRGLVNLTRLGLFSLISVCFMVALTTGLKLGKEWFNQQQKAQELQKQRLQSELKYLKSQINPHFLFNTLNNLYSLTLKKSDKAPEMVLKLSEIMRYMLYDSNERMVPLEKEINYIRNYIELEKLRQDKRTKIDLEIDWKPNGQQIAPLLFIPFLENSFKHGVNNNIESGWINIRLTEKDGKLDFLVENNKPKKPRKNLNGNGIGLVNVKRRLQLIYPEKHELKIEEDDLIYKTELKLQL